MNSLFSHLVWLGAGTASEPANILNTADHVTLIEARETTCQLLKAKYTQANIDIKQQLVDVASNNVLFNEYNLTEYSAITSATGLKNLFPGLRKTGAEQLTSTAIAEIITELSLSGNNNLLVIDIQDLNFALLQALQESKQLFLFKNIYIHTALESLYINSSTVSDVITFMENSGYDLLQKNDQDPELPWLTFFANPLWAILEKTKQDLAAEKHANNKKGEELKESTLTINTLQQTNRTLQKELDKIKQDLTVQLQTKESINKELEIIKQNFTEQQKLKEAINKELEKTKQDLTIQLQSKESINKELEITKRNLTEQQKVKETLSKELENIKQDLTAQLQAKEALSKQLEKAKQEFFAQNTTTEKTTKNLEIATTELELLKNKLTTEKNQNESIKKELEIACKREKEKAIEKLQLDFDNLNRTATNRKDLVLKLEKENISLTEKNSKLEKKQIALEQEMIKADAQITLIKDLFLKQ